MAAVAIAFAVVSMLPRYLWTPAPGSRVLLYAAIATPVCLWLAVRLWRARPLPPSGLEWPLLAPGAAYAASLLRSTDLRLSLESVFAVATLFLGFYALLDYLRTPRHRALVVNVSLMLGLLFNLFAVAQLVDWYVGFGVFWKLGGWLPLGGWEQPLPPTRLRIGMAWPSLYAAFANVFALLALGKLLHAQGRARHAWAAYLALAWFAVWQTYTRGGWLGGASGAVLLLLLALARRGGVNIVAMARTHRYLFVLGSVLAMLLLGGMALVALPSMRLRGISSDMLRLELWRVALVTMLAHIPTGSGPGTWGHALLASWRPEYAGVLEVHAHNAYLQIGAELGIACLAALLWLLGAFVRLARRGWQEVRTSDEWWLYAAALAVLAALGLHSLVDNFLDQPIILLWLLCFSGIVLALGRAGPAPLPARPQQPRQRWELRAGLAVLLCGYLASLVLASWPERARAVQQAALVAAAQGDWQSAAATLEQAAALDPALGAYHFQLGIAYARLATQEPAGDWLARAIAAFRRDLALEPHYSTTHANLAALLWQAGHSDEAIAEMARAAALDPRRPHYAIALGRFLEAAGRLDEAIEAYAEGLSRRPELARSSFWRLSEFRRAAWEHIVALAVQRCEERPPWNRLPCRRTLAYLSGSASLQDLAADPLLAGEAALERGEADRAIEAFGQAARRSPTPAAYLGLARAHLLRGDLAAAERAVRIARFVSADTLAFASDDNPQVHDLLGRIAAANGRLDAAVAHYARAIPGMSGADPYEEIVWRRYGIGTREVPQLEALAIEAGMPDRLAAYQAYIDTLRRRGTPADLAEAQRLSHRLDQDRARLATAVPSPTGRPVQ
jgi:tetratricopeptide (TPR) repeat protein